MEMFSDEALAVVVPILLCWAYCGLHVALGQSIYMDKYRLHPSAHQDSKNYVSKREVLETALKQQLVQLAMAALVSSKTTHMNLLWSSTTSIKYLLPAVALQMAVAMIWYDRWQYAWHRILHANRFLYCNFHSWHHRLVSPRASIFFFSICTVKVIDNHCGFSLPSSNNSRFWNNADDRFGTYMPYVVEKTPQGMLRIRAPGLDYRRSNE
ncbi:hypothetical protein BRADI_1g52713v3 [Brachypodium distachyon]|uniref:Fatty acid hydroxylase domain-containing protein n=1 Tax=Brachypodium distachyon TaxID=15368 RepID=A0A0Q3NRM4_BRADI|nr:hypothetical protein BRADI_1g52713v3 [Brachypodium distachyon]